MHLVMLAISFILAWGMRLIYTQSTSSWTRRWQQTLFFFIFPPLLILMTVIAIIFMGFRGEMMGMQASWFSYFLAIFLLIIAVLNLVKLAYQGYNSIQQIQDSFQQIVAGKKAKIIEIDFPYSAQIGFWNSELVISKGLLNILDREHLEAVLAHEQAHYHYRDTFWFFWLGWLRSLFNCLPNTENLWQELLLLREIRADRFATETVDSLILAESLLTVAQAPFQLPETCCANFSCTIPKNRLEERINALLDTPESVTFSLSWVLSWIFCSFLPLLTLPLHY